MSNRLVPMSLYLAKLRQRAPLSDSAASALLGLDAQHRTLQTYREITHEGDASGRCCLIVEGVASRFKSLRGGGRQIVSFHIAGDMVDLSSCLLQVVDYGIRTHSPTTIATYAYDDILDIADRFPELGHAFWFDTMVDGAVFAEWTVNVGRRNGRERVAHLLLEFAYRLKTIGQGDGLTFPMPVTQADLADAAGLSPVHVNRSLQGLRAAGLIRTRGRTITICDYPALAREAEFTDLYLHPEGPRRVRVFA